MVVKPVCVLTCVIIIRYTVDEELDGTEACLLPGYVLIAHGNLVQGPVRPATLADCEVRP